MKPPIAKRVDFQRTLHGKSWNDPYHWLRAPNWQACIEDPDALPEDIKQYLIAENTWCDHQLADTQALQARLLDEMKGRIEDVEQSLPDVDGPWCYLERYEQGDEHARYFRYPQGASTGKENMTLLINLNEEAEQYEYFDCGDYDYNPTHTHLAWTADTRGSERYQARIRNLLTGEDEDLIDDVYDIAWGSATDLFYTRLDADYRASAVYRHTLGTPSSDDVLIFEEHDVRFSCDIWTSLSRRYFFISSSTDDQSEVWFIPSGDIHAKAQLIEARTQGLEYSVEHQGDRFFIVTNADGASDFKVVTAPCGTPSRANWIDFIPYREGIMLLDFYAYENWLMWLERENALPRICFCPADNHTHVQSVDFDEQAYAISLEPLLEFNESVFRFSFETPALPAQTFSFGMQSGERQLLKQDKIPSGHNSADYRVLRAQAQAHDGELVPVTVLHHRNTALDGSAPCLLYAYGAYGSSCAATFSSSILSLVDRGFVYAVAHVRGGQEKGRAWYDDAREHKKQNTFDDVVAVAHHLIKTNYTDTGRLVLYGASAGGLMVGAVLNQTTDLWAGAIAQVPFVDAINSLIDDTLPLTPGEWSQWGNPLADSETFDYIQRYSPYDNVQSRAYPPLLVTAGVSDPRVTYWEPAKWVAKHRHQREDSHLLLLKTNMSTGHFGESGRYASLKDEALEQAFALKVVGLA